MPEGAQRSRHARLRRLDSAVGRYEEAARMCAGHKIEPGRPILLKAAQIYFEQQQPEAALDLGRRHASPSAAGVHGMAYLEAGRPFEADRHLRFAIKAQRLWTYPDLLPSFFSYILAHFYPGKLLEQTGKKAEAIDAYKEFLRHFENSTARLPQIAEARAALKRLL